MNIECFQPLNEEGDYHYTGSTAYFIHKRFNDVL